MLEVCGQQEFENRIAQILASELDARVVYAAPGERCDVLMGGRAEREFPLTTRPYYRSSYVFVTRAVSRLYLRSLDDPRLQGLKLGVQLGGPSQALAQRGLENVAEFAPTALIRAVETGELDVGLVWGPLAGAFACAADSPLTISVIDSSGVDQQFSSGVCLGLRAGNTVLRDALERALDRRQAEIDIVLREFGVPLTELRSPTAVLTR